MSFESRTADEAAALKPNRRSTTARSASQSVAVSRAKRVALWPFLILLATIVVASAIRLRLLSMPLERDEGEYAYAGQLILQGHPPYERLYNMKWPGTYYCYALFEAIFGQTIEGVHFGVLLVNVAAIVLVFFICRRLLDAYAAKRGGGGVCPALAQSVDTRLRGTRDAFCRALCTRRRALPAAGLRAAAARTLLRGRRLCRARADHETAWNRVHGFSPRLLGLA